MTVCDDDDAARARNRPRCSLSAQAESAQRPTRKRLTCRACSYERREHVESVGGSEVAADTHNSFDVDGVVGLQTVDIEDSWKQTKKAITVQYTRSNAHADTREQPATKTNA